MELLIQMVQDNPVLYDTSHGDYMRGKLKDEIWEKIAKELNYTSGQMAKTQWRKLRDCFRDALRRQGKKKSGQGASVFRPWVYQKQMEFLIPHMMNRATSSNWSSSSSVTGGESDNCAMEAVNEEVDDSFQEIDMQNDLEAQNEDTSPLQKQQNKKLKTSNLNEAMMKSIEHFEKRAQKRDDLRKTITEKKTSEPNDPLYHFFMSMYKTTKDMPLAHQLQVKRKIFQTVSEAEEDVISSQMNVGASTWVRITGQSSVTSDSLSTYWTEFGNNSSS